MANVSIVFRPGDETVGFMACLSLAVATINCPKGAIIMQKTQISNLQVLDPASYDHRVLRSGRTQSPAFEGW